MSIEQYYRAINAATLQGFDYFADVLVILLVQEYPEIHPASGRAAQGRRRTDRVALFAEHGGLTLFHENTI